MEMEMNDDKRCGTCADWDKLAGKWSEYGVCRWSRRNLPAWTRSEPDMHETNGTDCATWSVKE